MRTFNPHVNPDRVSFVVMPFAFERTGVYQKIKDALDYCGLGALRADEISASGVVTEHIRQALVESRIVIADLTGLNPNVMYELGFAHGAGRPTILICDEAPSAFDVRNYRTIVLGGLSDDAVAGELKRAIREAIVDIPQRTSQPELRAGQILVKNVSAPRWSQFPHAFEIDVRTSVAADVPDQWYLAVSFPDGAEDIRVESSSPRTKIGLKGDRWKADRIVLQYPIAEAFHVQPNDQESGEQSKMIREQTLTVRAKPLKKGFFWFYVSACSLSASEWEHDPRRGSGVVCDQRDEPVFTGLIDVQ